MQDNGGPLHIAAEEGKTEVVVALLKAKATVDLPDEVMPRVLVGEGLLRHQGRARRGQRGWQGHRRINGDR